MGVAWSRVLPWAAVLLAASSPFWQAPVLGTLHLRSPAERSQAQLSLNLAQQARRIEDLQDALRLAEAAAAAARADAEAASVAARAAQARLSTLALIQLTAALRHPGRFETELAMAWAAGGAQSAVGPLLEQVRPYAPFGVPGVAQLRRDFATLAARADRGAAGGFLRLAWLGGLLGFSAAADSPPPDTTRDTADLLRRAASQLAGDDLAGALATTRKLRGTPRETLSDWIEDAAARVAADTLARQVTGLAAQPPRVAGPAP